MSLSLLSAMVVATGLAQAPAAAPAGHALIVTNNRSLSADRPDLQYADDDGAQYADLFSAVLADDGVTLLTRFDPESTVLHPRWVRQARPPTRANLLAAVAAVAARARPGDELYLVFAGHGDVDAGQGFLELEDGRLDAAQLEREVIARFGAQRVHLILDSCNSFFMLNPRKPGGRRFETTAVADGGLLSRHANVGAIVSTSAEAITYEWSALQSGIFSHEVRSGLRGGADADGDGRILYSELASFIAVANRPLVNDLYRPKIFARGQGADPSAVLLAAPPSRAARIRVPGKGQRRLTVRDANGVRVLDVHKEDGAPLVLSLPPQGALAITEQLPGKGTERPRVQTFFAEPDGAAGPRTLDELPFGTDIVSARGEAPVFASLFADPFGPRAYADVSTAVMDPPQAAAGFGATRRDAERLRLHLQYAADGARSQRFTGAGVLGLVGGATLGVGLLAPESAFGDYPEVQTAAVVGGAALLVSAAAVGLLRTDDERLHDEYLALDRSSERARTSAVTLMEARFEAAARSAERSRRIGGTVQAAVGLGSMAMGAFGFGGMEERERQLYRWGFALGGAGLFLQGLYGALFHRYPIERAWEFYQQGAELDRLEPAPGVPKVDLGVGPGGGVQVKLRGTF